ncbi:acyloxyacyl hydrolase [Magnetovibrio sp.]|uniref:acyloxyacyl hydrolase n=1 Tax=Magnetovibrio sp. TaxID=2024836 RepID=UPI002F92CD7C
MRFVTAIVSGLLASAAITAFAPSAYADDPAFLSIGAGTYDWNRKKDEGVEVRVEYRHDKKLFDLVKPFVAAAVSKNDSTQVFLGAGILMDIYLGKRFVVTPSFAPHYYHGGNAKLDLDYALEFRSQIEAAYRFDDRSRLGIAVSHYSNASLGKTNPGTESATLYYSIPVDFFN